ncbi:ORF6N domain-containing protein, partial [Adlercreutzia sp. ZJ242]|uniref:ORF6N domain-containing protein n=1 Tax=Adlercreutzia sp. ZJ242 TaxID=2709409 RepID=UPI00197DC82E
MESKGKALSAGPVEAEEAASVTIVPANEPAIRDLIYTVRGMQVMLDSDLAALYGVETKVFNQAVRRNVKRFPDRFRFQLTQEEAESLRSQAVTSNGGRDGRRYLPYAFTEQGCRCSRRCCAATRLSKLASGSWTASSRCAVSSPATPPCSSRYAR